MSVGARLLALGGALSFAVALLHAACIVIGEPAYRYFGAGEGMAQLASHGSPYPALVTAGLVVCFVGFGIYAFSGAGIIRRLPFLRTVLVAIGLLHALRGVGEIVVLQIVVLAIHPSMMPVRYAVFSAVALAIGLIHLVGTVASWQTLSERPA